MDKIAKRKAVNSKSSKKWYLKNKKKAISNSTKWKKTNPEKVLSFNLNTRYKKLNFTSDEYHKLEKKQKGVCAICSTKDKSRRLALDHCHKKNTVRGLLCSNCNRGLGMLKDNPKILKLAIKYLEKHA